MFTIRSNKNYFKNIHFKERGGEGVSKTILQGVILQRIIILVGNSPEGSLTRGKFSKRQFSGGQLYQGPIILGDNLAAGNLLGKGGSGVHFSSTCSLETTILGNIIFIWIVHASKHLTQFFSVNFCFFLVFLAQGIGECVSRGMTWRFNIVLLHWLLFRWIKL